MGGRIASKCDPNNPVSLFFLFLFLFYFASICFINFFFIIIS